MPRTDSVGATLLLFSNCSAAAVFSMEQSLKPVAPGVSYHSPTLLLTPFSSSSLLLVTSYSTQYNKRESSVNTRSSCFQTGPRSHPPHLQVYPKYNVHKKKKMIYWMRLNGLMLRHQICINNAVAEVHKWCMELFNAYDESKHRKYKKGHLMPSKSQSFDRIQKILHAQQPKYSFNFLRYWILCFWVLLKL